MIAIIDYGMGNIGSITNALNFLGLDYVVTDDSNKILAADKVILPGVGAFRDAIKRLSDKGLDKVIDDVVKSKKPILGICLGFQLLFAKSYENGEYDGFGYIESAINKLDSKYVKVPQIGWNSIKITSDCPLFKGVKDNSYFYFVHSYACLDTSISTKATITSYGVDFVSSVWKDNVYGLQFHPEKSGEVGLQILKNFGEL